jgi:hypothetical protein
MKNYFNVVVYRLIVFYMIILDIKFDQYISSINTYEAMIEIDQNLIFGRI